MSKFTHVRTDEIGETVEVYRNVETGQYHVVQEYGDRQVRSIMPWDKPHGGSHWIARKCDAGIAYVSYGRSPSYVNRTIKRLREKELDR